MTQKKKADSATHSDWQPTVSGNAELVLSTVLRFKWISISKVVPAL
jgi:hypothetical protein